METKNTKKILSHYKKLALILVTHLVCGISLVSYLKTEIEAMAVISIVFMVITIVCLWRLK